MKLCKDCVHYVQQSPCGHECFRNTKKKVDPVTGFALLTGKILDCHSERGGGVKAWRCGPEGKYWQAKGE